MGSEGIHRETVAIIQITMGSGLNHVLGQRPPAKVKSPQEE